MNAKHTPSECVTNVVGGLNEKREATNRSLASHFEASSEWLAEAIQTCKRKILEGTGHEVTESKRMKPTTACDKENTVHSVENSKLSSKTKLLKKAVSAASVKKAIPASTQKAPESRFDTHPSYLRIMSLKVSDLKNELRQRELDTTGLKKELQNRLLKDVVKGESNTKASKNSSKSVASLEKAKEAVDGGADVEMKDATKVPTDAEMEVCVESDPSWNESMTDVTTMSFSNKQATASEYRVKVPEPDVKETDVGKSFLKSTVELFSPGRIASKVMSSKRDADVSVPSTFVPCETKQKPEAIRPLRNSLAESFKKTASAILSASPIGKAKATQSTKSPLPKDKTAKALDTEKSTVVFELVDPTETKSSSADSFKNAASALLSASPIGKAKTAQSSKSPSPKYKAPDAVKSSVVFDLVDPTETKSSSAQPKQPEISSKAQSQLLPSKPVTSVQTQLNNAGAATKEKRNKTAADRMARLAEIRGKSKPVAGSKSVAAKELPALSASKRLQLSSSAKDAKSDRKGLLTAQMREKAAAGLKRQKSSKVIGSSKGIVVSQQEQAKAHESVAPVVCEQSKTKTKETVSSAVSQQKQANAQESVAPVASQRTQANTQETISSVVSQQKQAEAQESVASVASYQTQAKKKETEASVLSQQIAQESVASVQISASPKVFLAKKPAESTASAAPRSVSKIMASSAKKAPPRPDILSPMSTYEISDREQSDTDDSDSDCDQKRNKKKVPSWAERSNLLPALELQYVNKDGRLDPETIFPPVSSCNLEEIFDQKKSRYNRRTSSANWSKDGVTVHEIVNYKRTMGY